MSAGLRQRAGARMEHRAAEPADRTYNIIHKNEHVQTYSKERTIIAGAIMKPIKFKHESLILAQDERWRRA